jgi:hypothetical protein
MSPSAPAPTRRRGAPRRLSPEPPTPGALSTVLPPEWRVFVGHWLEGRGCEISGAARGDWEVGLSAALQRRWRRQRVRLVFDPQRPTLPRGAWFTAPGSGAGRKLLDAALDEPVAVQRTALAQVPGAPESGLASVCKVRGLSWAPPRLGPVRYERRVSFHAVITRWGGLPLQEAWVTLVGEDGTAIERAAGPELEGVRMREGLYQITEPLTAEDRARWCLHAREHFGALLAEREREWESEVARHRDAELRRLGAFFSARIEEEEERLRRRTGGPEESDIEHGGDATSLKLDWERRAAEVGQRWAIRTELRLWGVSEWSWPVADLEQELRSGAVHVRLRSRVDVARGQPALPACPTCGVPAEMLVRVRGSVACVRCAPA